MDILLNNFNVDILKETLCCSLFYTSLSLSEAEINLLLNLSLNGSKWPKFCIKANQKTISVVTKWKKLLPCWHKGGGVTESKTTPALVGGPRTFSKLKTMKNKSQFGM